MNLQEIKNQYDAAVEAAKKSGQDASKEVFKEFFEQFPEVDKIQWTQYTPYFNDGDACTFGVNKPDFILDDGNVVSSWYGDGKKYVTDSLRALFGFELLMESVFGDHVEVTVTRQGIEIDEYDHD